MNKHSHNHLQENHIFILKCPSVIFLLFVCPTKTTPKTWPHPDLLLFCLHNIRKTFRHLFFCLQYKEHQKNAPKPHKEYLYILTISARCSCLLLAGHCNKYLESEICYLQVSIPLCITRKMAIGNHQTDYIWALCQRWWSLSYEKSHTAQNSN